MGLRWSDASLRRSCDSAVAGTRRPTFRADIQRYFFLSYASTPGALGLETSYPATPYFGSLYTSASFRSTGSSSRR